MENPAEIVFAQRLASNEKTIRDRALKKLRKYLSVRGSQADLSRDDLRKLWKGLHYSMWMQDKPLLQEELSTKICSLLKVFSEGSSALNFAAAFFATEANEWNRLDQWRMDKYMMLTRDFVRATLEAMRVREWDAELVGALAGVVETEVMDPARTENPDGLRLHLADIWLQELTAVGGEELTGQLLLTLIRPFINYVVQSKRRVIADRVSKSIFDTILDGPAPSDLGEGEEEEDTAPPRLQFDMTVIGQALFEEGRKDSVLPSVRKKLYGLFERFQAAASTAAVPEPKQPVTVEKNKASQKPKTAQKIKIAQKLVAAPKTETAQKRKRTDGDEPGKKKKKKYVVEVEVEAEETEPTPKTKKSKPAAKETPESARKQVVFDLKRNSSRGLKEFVMSAADSPSPYLPSRSPSHGILKDSPGGSTQPSTPVSRRTKKKAALVRSLAAEGSTSKGRSPKGKGSKFEDMSGNSGKGKKAKAAKYLARKKARRMTKSSA